MVEQNDWLVIPFYSDPTSGSYETAVSKFGDFLVRSKETIGLNLAVIDDGSNLTLEKLRHTPDFLVTLPKNKGKSHAMREGLRALLKQNPGFIVQYDGDGDQSYVDIPVVYNRLIAFSGGNPDAPVLVIGDRYSEDLTIPPNPESVVYRQTILMFFGALAKHLGFDDVRDWVSGARGYSREYAKRFLSQSKSSRYGLESEQLVVASLTGAKVTTAPLTQSRPRDPDTLTSKWLQNFEVYSDHEQALREQGKGVMVDLVYSLVDSLKKEIDEFDLPLDPIGEKTTVHFTRRGDRYAAEIPLEYRARLFMVEDKFPFTIRKSSIPTSV
ncbi:MAG: hypothetical protein HYW45_02410 [Candidatus Daviesbacteria bacterium]|nr:MAG: hypothetical protein HYW45_02410 [Candidatus Daviesbacteria bacterium]